MPPVKPMAMNQKETGFNEEDDFDKVQHEINSSQRQQQRSSTLRVKKNESIADTSVSMCELGESNQNINSSNSKNDTKV